MNKTLNRDYKEEGEDEGFTGFNIDKFSFIESYSSNSISGEYAQELADFISSKRPLIDCDSTPDIIMKAC